MGLDMYLYARKHIPLDSEAATTIIEAATRHDAEAFDPGESDSEAYVRCWDYQQGGDRTLTAEASAVLAASGLNPIFNVDNGIGIVVRMLDTGLELRVECAYWRKANAVHDWFVRECQGGVDECQVSDAINGEKLAQLRSECQKAIELFDAGRLDEAGKVLAPTAGFLFGSTEIDEWYRRDLEDTVSQIERVVNATIAMREPGLTFHYHSSW